MGNFILSNLGAIQAIHLTFQGKNFDPGFEL